MSKDFGGRCQSGERVPCAAGSGGNLKESTTPAELVLHSKVMGLLGTLQGVSPLCIPLEPPRRTEEVAH